MATQYINKAIANATVSGQSVSFESNAVTAELFDVSSVTLLKAQSSGLVVSGGKITYTVTITNLTLSPVLNFNFEDIIPTGMSYEAGTFKINTVSQTPVISGQNLSYQIPSLGIGITVVTFNCNVT